MRWGAAQPLHQGLSAICVVSPNPCRLLRRLDRRSRFRNGRRCPSECCEPGSTHLRLFDRRTMNNSSQDVEAVVRMPFPRQNSTKGMDQRFQPVRLHSSVHDDDPCQCHDCGIRRLTHDRPTRGWRLESRSAMQINGGNTALRRCSRVHSRRGPSHLAVKWSEPPRCRDWMPAAPHRHEPKDPAAEGTCGSRFPLNNRCGGSDRSLQPS